MDRWEWFLSPVHALPLDIFRVLVGVVALAYFARTWREAPEFSATGGLLDHALVRRSLPFSRHGLFPPNASLRLLQGLYASGCLAAVLLTAGIEPRLAAIWLYLLAVSAYRRNLVLMYVDDAVMHLVLFWAVLLPFGETLTLPALLAEGPDALEGWKAVLVPGLGVRAFVLNLVLIYLVAGLWKWTSPLWRSGWAVYAVLRMAVSYAPTWWRPSQRPLLVAANYAALVLEPLFPLLAVLPPGSPAKWVLAVGALGFHLGIIATMRFPFANVAMLAAGVVLFGPELMAALGAPPAVGAGPPPTPGDWFGLATVVCLALLFLTNALWFRDGAPTQTWNAAAGTRRRLNPLYVPLWVVGLAQSYRLFDWIDERNHTVEYAITGRSPGGPPRKITPGALFPTSMRHVLLQSYLYGNLWVRIDPRDLEELRSGILRGYAQRYARAHPAAATVEVDVLVRRVTLDNLDLHREVRMPLLRFAVRDGAADVAMACVRPPAFA